MIDQELERTAMIEQIPDFQSIMRPLLESMSDGSVKDTKTSLDDMLRSFGLSESALNELLPSGQPRLTNRVAWAKSHMKAAGLITSPKRGHYAITPVGVDVLRTHKGPINLALLRQFPGHQLFTSSKSELPKDTVTPVIIEVEMTPEEHIEFGHDQLRRQLAVDVLDKVMASPPRFFEQLVVDLLVSMGYGGSRADAGKAVEPGKDGGIDGIIKEDRLGLDTIYIQAKRWEGSVGRPEIQKFAGALQGVRARKGIFITTSSYTADAKEYVKNIDSKIVLIDGKQLAGLMIDHNIGVTRIQTYELKRLDSDYFVEEE
jgi:restriction system protein